VTKLSTGFIKAYCDANVQEEGTWGLGAAFIYMRKGKSLQPVLGKRRLILPVCDFSK
jgi:hypothetical protein